jgi:hypothetical protein
LGKSSFLGHSGGFLPYFEGKNEAKILSCADFGKIIKKYTDKFMTAIAISPEAAKIQQQLQTQQQAAQVKAAQQKEAAQAQWDKMYQEGVKKDIETAQKEIQQIQAQTPIHDVKVPITQSRDLLIIPFIGFAIIVGLLLIIIANQMLNKKK